MTYESQVRLATRSVSAFAIGIDLAWSPRNPTGLAAATVTPDRVVVLETATARTNAEILSFVRRFTSAPVTIAIDAPTIVPNETGMRPVERLLQRSPEFKKVHAAPYPANRQLLGKHNQGAPRGEELVFALTQEFDARQIGCPPLQHTGIYAMEVFPLGAMPRLFGAPFVYKAKKGRTLEQCQDGLRRYLDGLRGLSAPGILIPDELRVAGESGRALKAIEDQADAVLCAYIAGLGWLGQVEAIGGLRSGYIVLPAAGPYRTGAEKDPVFDTMTTSVEIRQCVWPYLASEWDSWADGDRNGYPRDTRLKFWRGNRITDQTKYGFGETYVAAALMRQGFTCWTWFELFGEATTDQDRRENGDEIRRLLRETGHPFDPSQIAAALDHSTAMSPPDVIAYHPRTNVWRFIEVKRQGDSLSDNQTLALAAVKHFLRVEAEVIHLREQDWSTQRPPLTVELRLHRLPDGK